MPHTFRTSVAASLLALTLPVTTLAATPAQIVQHALQTASTKFPISHQFTMDMHVKDTTFATKKTTDGTVSLSLDQRILSKNGSTQDTEGTLTVSLSSSQPVPLESLFMLGDAPSFSVDWKRVGTDVYFRIRNLPASWIEALKARESSLSALDLATYVNRWIHLDGEVANGLTPLMDQQENLLPGKTGDTFLDNVTNLLKDTNLFLVTHAKKATTNAAGDKIQRVHLRLNPAILAKWRQAELKKVDRKSSGAKTQLKAINDQHAAGKKLLARLSFAANVNLTTQTLERLEYGYHGTEPRKTCVWNEKTLTANCHKAVGMTTYHVTGAWTPKKSLDRAVDPPNDPLSLQSLVEAYKQAHGTRLNGLAETHTQPITRLNEDADGDGIPDLDESAKYGTDPALPDTDGDGFGDGAEILNGFNPLGLGTCTKPGCLR